MIPRTSYSMCTFVSHTKWTSDFLTDSKRYWTNQNGQDIDKSNFKQLLVFTTHKDLSLSIVHQSMRYRQHTNIKDTLLTYIYIYIYIYI